MKLFAPSLFAIIISRLEKMTQPRKPIAELRKELKKMMIDISVAPSQMKKREDIEQMIGMYGKFAEVKKSTPLPERSKGGRPKAREVEAKGDDGGIAVPKKVVKEKSDRMLEREKYAKKKSVPTPSVAEDSGTGSESEEEERVAKKAVEKVAKAAVEKPKRVLTEEQKAKMMAGRLAKKAAAMPSAEKPTPKPAEPKKDTPPPDAPPTAAAKAEKRIPVFKNA